MTEKIIPAAQNTKDNAKTSLYSATEQPAHSKLNPVSPEQPLYMHIAKADRALARQNTQCG